MTTQIVYKTKSSKTKKFREILHKYNTGDIVNQNDLEILMFLFSFHPSWEFKKGVGLKNIQIIKDRWHKKAFIINRIDNSHTDISIVVAANGSTGSLKTKICAACRKCIEQEIYKFKDTLDWNNIKCPFTGEQLTKSNTHIDHYDLTFKELFEEWLKTQDFNFLVSNLNDSRPDNVVYDEFTSNKINNDFINFHNSHTHLRAVSKIANLSFLKSKNGRQNK